MAHQMVQEGALWPSSMIRLGPQWHNSKITWANFVHAVLDVDTWNTIKLVFQTWLEQLKIQWLTHSLTWANLVQAKNLIKNPDIHKHILTHTVQLDLNLTENHVWWCAHTRCVSFHSRLTLRVHANLLARKILAGTFCVNTRVPIKAPCVCLSVCSKTMQQESTYARDFLVNSVKNIPPLVTKHYFKCTYIVLSWLLQF